MPLIRTGRGNINAMALIPKRCAIERAERLSASVLYRPTGGVRMLTRNRAKLREVAGAPLRGPGSVLLRAVGGEPLGDAFRHLGDAGGYEVAGVIGPRIGSIRVVLHRDGFIAKTR